MWIGSGGGGGGGEMAYEDFGDFLCRWGVANDKFGGVVPDPSCAPLTHMQTKIPQGLWRLPTFHTVQLVRR